MSKKGFTLIELLIGVTVSALIFLTAGSMINLLFRTDVKSQRVENLEQAKNDILVQLSNSLRWASSITFSSGDSAQIVADNETFSLSEGKILRNGEPITPNNVKITKFKATNYSSNPALLSLEIQVDLESSTTATSKDSMNIVISQRQTVLVNTE